MATITLSKSKTIKLGKKLAYLLRTKYKNSDYVLLSDIKQKYPEFTITILKHLAKKNTRSVFKLREDTQTIGLIKKPKTNFEKMDDFIKRNSKMFDEHMIDTLKLALKYHQQINDQYISKKPWDENSYCFDINRSCNTSILKEGNTIILYPVNQVNLQYGKYVELDYQEIDHLYKNGKIKIDSNGLLIVSNVQGRYIDLMLDRYEKSIKKTQRNRYFL